MGVGSGMEGLSGHAAVAIQRIWRGWNVRRECMDRRHRQLLTQIEDAVTRITAWWRMLMAQRQRRILLFIRGQERELNILVSNASTIQRCWRGHVERKDFAIFVWARQNEKENKAAFVLQQELKKAKRRKQRGRKMAMLDNAARKVQAMARRCGVYIICTSFVNYL